MKRTALAILATLVCTLTFAQVPAHHLGKTVSELRRTFTDLEYGWTEDDGKAVYVQQDQDEYHSYTFYFTMSGGRVWSESLMVKGRGVIPNAEYFFYVTTVKKYYTNKGWTWCDVDSSILRAASIFNSEHRLVWADKFSAEFHYPGFLIFFKYNADSKSTTMSYFYN